MEHLSWSHAAFWFFLVSGAVLLGVGARKPEKRLGKPDRSCERNGVEATP